MTSQRPAPKYLLPYYRVSTDNKGQDTERQTVACIPWAEREGYHLLPAEHEEESAFKVPALQRPGFVAACVRAAAAKAEGLLMETPDRFSREDPEVAIWQKVEVLRKYEIKLYFACMTKEMQVTPMGKCFLFMQQTSGHVWVVDHSKKILSGNVRARTKGIRLGRKPKEVSFEEEAQIELWRKDHGWETVANMLNEQREVHKLTDNKVRKARSISASALKRWWRAKSGAESEGAEPPGETHFDPEGEGAGHREALTNGTVT